MLMPSRKLLTLLHGWLGSFSALFIILVAGSGVMLAFVGELFLVQYGDTLKATPSNKPIASISTLIESAKQGYQEDFQTVGVLMPHSRIEEIETAMVFVMPLEKDAEAGIRMISIDPWKVSYKGDFPLSGAFAHELIDFHFSFLLGNYGTVFVCILSILLIFFAATGLYLWWPKNNKVWRKASTVNFRGSLKSICFSLHSWLGVWSALLIIYFSLTGLALAKPEWFSPLLSPPTFSPPKSAGFDKTCAGKVTPNDAELAGSLAFPERELATFFMPNTENGPYMLTYKAKGDNNKRDGDGRIYIHATCKDLVHIARADLSKFSVKITDMLLSLHGGYTFGKVLGVIMVVFAGVSLLIMTGTGLVTFFTRTLRKRKS
ncbi:PepSY-associated TM helix domain-containing protein [Colwellia sp. E2M01]|uniref:PepSY-associated TM helix domain-containing protein n=1 Tax=Colwellia sp. E2M01 TaxID=2841561 RepID=UPI001C0A04FC|nr:PepSY-associated TM helix domain-containing protein [Colwellia sp. E2M01]MBU2869853.1 PepSY domain-containing protein [Colwellia sp. E2M01]